MSPPRRTGARSGDSFHANPKWANLDRAIIRAAGPLAADSAAFPTGYTRADQAHQAINASGMTATFRKELGDVWTVRLGPLAREAMVLVVQRYA